MNEFDFKTIGIAIKRERKRAGMTREQLSEIMHISPRYLISIENDGQAPSFQVFYDLVRSLNISVDQYIFNSQTCSASTLRRNTYMLMDTLTESELIIIEATIRGILEFRNSNTTYVNHI